MASLIGSGTVSNPMTSDLLANGFNISGSATVTSVRAETQTLAVPAGSGLLEVVCEDSLLIQGNNSLLFGAPSVGTTSISIQGDPGRDVVLGPIPAGAAANVIGYDTATNKLTFFATPGGGGGTVTGVGAGANIVVDNTNPAVPVVSLAEPITYTATNITTTYDVAGLSQVAFDPAVGLGRFDTTVTTGVGTAFIGGGSVAGGTHSLRFEVPAGDALIQHETLSGANKNLIMSSEGTVRVQGGVGSIQNELIVAQGATGVVVQGVGFVANSGANSNTLSAGVNFLTASARNEFNAGATAGNANPNTFITSGAGGAGNPMIRMENTNAVGSCALEVYKNKPTAGVAGDVLYNQSVFGKDAGNAKQEYTRVSHTIRDGAIGGEDGSIEFSCFSAGAIATFIQINGVENQVNILKAIDLTNQDLLNVKQIALGSLTGVGTAGQVITSRGTAGGTTIYSNPNQTPIASNLSGQSIDDTTPNFNFACGSGPVATFVPVANNRYRVDFSVSLEGPNKDILCFPRITYNGIDYFGDIYRNPSGGGGHNPFVSAHITAGGLHYHSINFTDYFTIPFSASLSVGYAVGILTAVGTATVNTARVCATISPCFD
jgi:hypothetical protein